MPSLSPACHAYSGVPGAASMLLSAKEEVKNFHESIM